LRTNQSKSQSKMKSPPIAEILAQSDPRSLPTLDITTRILGLRDTI